MVRRPRRHAELFFAKKPQQQAISEEREWCHRLVRRRLPRVLRGESTTSTTVICDPNSWYKKKDQLPTERSGGLSPGGLDRSAAVLLAD